MSGTIRVKERMLHSQTRTRIAALAMGLLLLVSVGCSRHTHRNLDITESAEPDKVLYNKAVEDIKSNRYEVARLTLQTLINTYPESVHLADAKLAVADSYYEEGTTTALAHAEIEYKDYITFFPNSVEAPRSQYRAAMTHYRQLELPDRDQTHARRAETEFQNLIKMFPDSDFAEEGVIKLLEVQEVLAQGEYLVGRFYFVRKFSPQATISRLEDLVERYPNFSQRDTALWMTANTWARDIPEVKWVKNEELAGDYFMRLVREHPGSQHHARAKQRLEAMGLPVPEPDPLIVERLKSVKTVGQRGEKPSLLKRMFGRLSGRPDTSKAAARLGPPPLEPPDNVNNLPFRQMRKRKGGSSSVSITGASSDEK